MIILLLKKFKIKIGNIYLQKLTIAKKSYRTFCNIIERNLYSTMKKLSIDERDKIK